MVDGNKFNPNWKAFLHMNEGRPSVHEGLQKFIFVVQGSEKPGVYSENNYLGVLLGFIGF